MSANEPGGGRSAPVDETAHHSNTLRARIKQIFQEAARSPSRARALLLARARKEDPEAAREAGELLAFHRPDTVLERSRAGDRGRASTDGKTRGRHRTAAALAIALLVAFVLALWFRARIEGAMRAKQGAELGAMLRSAVQGLELWIEGWQREAELRASDPAVQEHVASLVSLHRAGASPEALWASPARTEFYREMRPYLESRDSAWVVVLSPDGVVLADAGHVEYIGMRLNRFASAALSDVLAGTGSLVSPYVEDGGATRSKSGFGKGRTVTAVLVPIRDETGNPSAVLAFGRWTRGTFEGLFETARLGESGRTYAFNQEGIIVSEGRLDQSIRAAAASSRYKSDVASVRTLTEAAALAIGTRPEERDEPRSGTLLDAYQNHRGESVVGTWAWLPAYQLGLVSEVPTADAYQVLHYLDGLMAAVLFVGIASGIVWLRTRPARPKRVEDLDIRPYRIKGPIGEGGMGRVYLAEHERLQRPAAIKVLHKNELTPEDMSRFEREVRATCQLTHPNTIDILDFGRTREGILYYAMEYVSGETLSALVGREGPLSERRAARILMQVCASLSEAHEKGLVHRDIKPQNIMIGERGGMKDFVKVLDFGLVKKMERTDTTSLTAPAHFGGTPMYMAPERFREPRDVDARSDLYSLGVVAYYLVTGATPFHADSDAELLFKIFNERPRPPSEVAHRIPFELDTLIMNCLQKNPDDRPRSAADLAARLRGIDDGSGARS